MSFDLPKAFDDFDDARKEGFMNIKNLREQGKTIIGTYCVYTPYEIMMAGGAIAISLCSMSDESIPAAEKDLPRNLCPLIKASYGFAVTDTCPYFYFADLIVGETTCDGKKKMFELMNEVKPVHVMQLPNVNDTEDAFKLWRNEMVRLKERIEKELNVTITNEDLKEAIKLRNKERVTLKNFYQLSKLTPPPMTGMEMLSVLFGSTFKTDIDEKISSIEEIGKNLMEDYNNGVRKVSEDAPRILVTGSPIGGATQKIVKIIEEAGGVVVCYENCTGVKSYEELVDETIDPYDALTKKYLNIPCSCMSPNTGRLDLLDQLVDEYKVDGVIDMILQACHTYNVETFSVKNFITGEKNIPYMNLETDYSQSDVGQLTTRISAFIEML